MRSMPVRSIPFYAVTWVAVAISAGCSFPTSEFHVGVTPGADVQDVVENDLVDASMAETAVDVQSPDVQTPDVEAPDVQTPDVVDAGDDVADVVDAGDAGDDVIDVVDAGDDVVDVVDAGDDVVDAADVVDTGPVCPTGQVSCGDTCVDIDNSVDHCGRCGNRCTASNGVPACAAGVCTFTCSAGFADCDMVASNGCEANLASPTTCGGCMNRCNNLNGVPTCPAGACAIACGTGFGNCDGDTMNGCEVNTNADVRHCGACGRACSNSNGAPGCAAGACTISCATGYGNCDGMVANGCETNTTNDATNCGTCGNRCSTGQSCVRGVCTTVCTDTLCSGVCTDTTTNVSNCGSCGRVCSFANATPRCVGGTCAIASCNGGYANCDATLTNGCETNIQTDVANCGACTNRCAFTNASATCVGGTCALGTCNTGYANCDGNPANGCETNLQTDLANCGACSARCAPANAVAACTAGVCGVARCSTGYANCNAAATDGCEVSTLNDTSNCGSCGNFCRNYVYGGTTVCTSGVCSPTCNAGYASCDGNANNGCEASTNTNLNCGSCGRTCSGTCTASGGTCGTAATGTYNRQLYVLPLPAFIDACSAAGHTNPASLVNIDDAYATVALPFAVRTWNNTLVAGTNINVASNGWFSFSSAANQSYYTMIPDPLAPNWVVAPYFTDLATSMTGVCIATIGTAPSRRFVIEWYDAVYLADRTRHVTFEAIVNESNSSIEFYYDTIAAPPPGQNITVGLESPTGAAGIVICNPANACTISSGSRISHAPG